MKVISFVGTLPSKLIAGSKENHKVLTLKNYAQGVIAAGDTGIISYDQKYQPCDVAVMLGWVHENGKRAPHLAFRQQLLDQQKASGGRVVIADSSLFLYKDTKNPHNYLRYSFDGVFPVTGEYCDQHPDTARWTKIQRDLGIDIKPWRNTGEFILVCLQRNGGWSMKGFNVVDWAMSTIAQLRKHTDRPVRIRTHPGDRQSDNHCFKISRLCQIQNIKNVEFSTAEELTRDFKHCWAVVGHNSSPTIAAAIEGIPIFLTDPMNSQAKEVCNTDLSLIESPAMPDRQAWINRLSQFHWSNQDLLSGACWRHMKQWLR